MDPVDLSKAFTCLIFMVLGYYVVLYWASLGGLFARARVLGWGRIGALVLGGQGFALRRALLPWLITGGLGAAAYALLSGEEQSLALFATIMALIAIGVRAGALGNFDQITASGGPASHRVARWVGGMVGLLAGGFGVALFFVLS